MNTSQFPSTKAMAYVYHGYNPTTDESYIGYRMRNVKKNISSSSDLGVIYFTSSKNVKPRFNEFIWTIVAEFFDANDAYDFEQLLIFESWKQPGTLNKHCSHGKLRLDTTGVTISNETRLKMSIAKSNMTDETKMKISIATLGENNPSWGKMPSDESKHKMRESHLGVPKTGKAAKGTSKPVITCPHCGKIGSVSNMKQHHFDNCKVVNILFSKI